MIEGTRKRVKYFRKTREEEAKSTNRLRGDGDKLRGIRCRAVTRAPKKSSLPSF